MPRKKPYTPKPAGVNFHPRVLEYLDQLCEEEVCDRSYLVNKIIRQYAANQGTPIDLKLQTNRSVKKAA